MTHLLSALVAVPAAGAVLLAVLPRPPAGLVRIVTPLASGVALLLALPLWFSFQPRGAQWQFVDQIEVAGWRWLAGVDGLAVALVLTAVLVAAVAALLLAREAKPRARGWGIAMLVLETGVLGALVSLELRQMFVFWQLAMLALVAMAMVSGARRRALAGIVILVVGAAGMLSGLLALGEQYHSLASVASFDVRQFQTMPVRRPVQMQAFVMLGLACLTPLVLLVLHAWSTVRSGGEAGAGLVASTLVAALAIFGFFRIVLPVLPQASRTFAAAMMIAGAAFAAAALVAAVTTRARVAIYWIGLAQASLAIVGLFAATPDAVTGAAMQVIAATLAVAALVPIATWSPAPPAGSRLDVTVALAAMVAVGAGIGGARLLASGLMPLGHAAAYGSLFVNILCGCALASTALRRPALPAGTEAGRALDVALAAPALGALLAIAVYPAPLAARLETSVARLIVRVSPEYASQVNDCLNQPAPPPPDSGLPPGAMLAAPCTEPTGATDPAVKR